jgi:hypothetical protein
VRDCRADVDDRCIFGRHRNERGDEVENAANVDLEAGPPVVWV